jgi:hypothetical protein
MNVTGNILIFNTLPETGGMSCVEFQATFQYWLN